MFIEVSSFYDRKRASGFNKTNFVNFSGEKKKSKSKLSDVSIS